MEATIIRAILYHFHEVALILTQFLKNTEIDPETREILDFLFCLLLRLSDFR